jgi:uncharacterized damage-inducible protein DinB
MSDLARVCRELLAYNIKADRDLIVALGSVSQENLLRETGTGHGSLLGTMQHIYLSEEKWLQRFLGAAGQEHDLENLPNLAAAFQEMWPQMEYFLASLTEDQLGSQLTWTDNQNRTISLELWHCVLHMVNHSSHHRGQLSALLRQLGYEPPAMGLVHHLGPTS